MKKNVIVCGGSSGIGYEVLKLFVDKGYRVYSTSRTKPYIESKNHIYYHSDFYENKSIENVCTQILHDTNGCIHAVINCVGDIIHESSIENISSESLNKTFQINFFSAVIISKLFFKSIKSNRGVFVFISSVAKDKIYPHISDYCSAKSALSNFVKSLAVELSPSARAVSISPAVVNTRLFQQSGFSLKEANSFHKLNRIGAPEEIANLIYFLSTDYASWITGTDYVIDGGMLL